MSSESTPIDEIKAFTPEIENSHPPTSETCKTSETLQVGTSPNSFGGNEGCYEEVNGENTPPISELPALLQDIIAETCKSTLVPSSLAIVPALGVLAGSLGGGVRIHRGGLLPRFLITDTHAEPADDPENPHTPDGGTMTQWEELIELALDYRDKAAARIAGFFEIHRPDHVWTWGIDFDCTILRNFLKTYNQRTPWTHWSQRDARTIDQVLGGGKSTPGATHNALEDCARQISIVQDCLARVTAS
jgi:hypothetical protein